MQAPQPIHTTRSSDEAYQGDRSPLGEVSVYRPNGLPLEPKRSQQVVNHSPTGFEWGYQGSGPAQLALAILLDITDNPEEACKNYQLFKLQVVGLIKAESWVMSVEFIVDWLSQAQPSYAPLPQWINDQLQQINGRR